MRAPRALVLIPDSWWPPADGLLPTAYCLFLPLLAVALSAAPSAQQPDAASTLIQGRVMAADGTPLARARITVDPAGSRPVSTAADADGRFEAALPAGARTVRIEKAGYVSREIAPPSSRAGSIDVSLEPAAVISGQVVDPTGEPVVNRAVRLVPVSRNASAARFTQTDDRGEYRIGGLAAGRYAASTAPGFDLGERIAHMDATRGAQVIDQLRREIDMVWSQRGSAAVTVEVAAGEELTQDFVQQEPAVTLPYAIVGGIIAGTIVDERGEPEVGAAVRLWQSRFADGRLLAVPAGSATSTDDRGRFRLFHLPAGRYFLMVTVGSDSLAAALSTSYLPQYYPGRTSLTDAWPIVVGPREEIAADMTLERLAGARVYGTAVNAAGRPLWGPLVLVATQQGPALPPQYAEQGANGRFAAPSARTESDGTFELRHIPPGTYALQAATLSAEAGHVQLGEFGVEQVVVGTGDVGPLHLQTQPTATISGSVAREGSGTARATEFGINVVPADRDEAPFFREIAPDAAVGPDWTFTLRGLTGRGRLVLTRGPAGWWLKSAHVNGVDAAEHPVNFGAGSSAEVTVVVSSTAGAVSGRVVDGGGEAVSSYVAVVFPADRAQWFLGSRYVKATDPLADGRFSFRSLPPADYFVAAVEDLGGDVAANWYNPDALEALAASAQRVSLTEGQSRTIELRLTELPR